MILTANQIFHRLSKGEIVIKPYHAKKLQPNGYDLHLHPTVLVPRVKGEWDVKKPMEYDKFEIGEDGFLLLPGILYIMSTLEYTESHTCIPVIEGKSSLARNGISVHQTAGFGEIGFCGNWTLEVSVIYPTRIYARMPIAQIIYHEPCGTYDTVYGQHGNHYQGQIEPTPTALWKGFENKILPLEE